MTNSKVPMLKRHLRPLKWALMDFKARLWRGRVPQHRGDGIHGLLPYQLYPKGANLSLEFITSPQDQFPRLINRETPIASIGSCFAVNMKEHLEGGQFNYINRENSWAGSAEWGRVYTTKNLLQIFQYSFSVFQPEVQFCHSNKGVFDPYREGRIYATEQEALESTAQHRKESRTSLNSCQVLIITVGQNEAWVSKSDGVAWTHRPPAEAFDKYGANFFELKQFSLEENITYLRSTLDLLWANNPESQVVITLSPVPSAATFYDANVSIRSFENKAILLLAVKEIVKSNPGKVHYFPSFEMSLLSDNPSLQIDNRHLRPQKVQNIMKSFDRCFLENG